MRTLFNMFWICFTSQLVPNHFNLLNSFVPLFFKYIQTSLWYANILECSAFHWSGSDLPRIQSENLLSLEMGFSTQHPSPFSICFRVGSHRSCACCHTHCESICVASLSCLEDDFPLVAIYHLRRWHSFYPFPAMFPEHWKERLQQYYVFQFRLNLC